MNIIEIISHMQLREKKAITKMRLAEMLGISYSYLQRFKDDDELPEHYIEGLEIKLGYKLKDDIQSSSYLFDEKSGYNFTRANKLTILRGDKEIHQGWWNSNPDNIRALRVFDDRMDNPNTPEQLEIGDIVSVDIGKTDIANGGVFLYTAELNGIKILRIARIKVQAIEGFVIFSWNNKDKYAPKSYTFEQLQQAKFKVIGRIMNNETHVIK